MRDDATGFGTERTINPTDPVDKVRYPYPAQKILETRDREQRVVEKEGWDDDTGFCIERTTYPTDPIDKVRYPRPAQKILEIRDREHGSWNWKERLQRPRCRL